MSDRQTTIGKYQIIREIARSNDIVYEAYDPLMNRRVALKELAMPGGLNETQREDRLKRFVREAKAAGSLNHPNIVTIYECGEESGKYFIAMEYLEGHTLRNELDTHGFLPPAKAMGIILEVLEGLEYAHQNGVIHRDIKPENIQLLPDGRVKLTDFGIARLTFEPNLTMDGQVFGTPSYMSPEQVVGKEIDARSDLFGVGVVLFEMLAGEKPFKGDSVVSITYSIMNVSPAQPNQANHTVWQFLSRALEKSPQLRFASAADMIKAGKAAEQSLHSVLLDPLPPTQTISTPYGAVPVLGAPPQMGAAPPVNNPYMGGSYGAYQQPAPAVPQAPVYPYDPYQTGAQQPYDPNQPYLASQPSQQPYNVPPGYVAAPVYYPPPRRPFVSPETKVFLGKLALTVIVLGTLFGLVLAGIWALGTAWERNEQQNRDTLKRHDIQTKAASLPLNERINLREQEIPKLTAEASRSEENQLLANDYQSRGRELLKQRDYIGASAAFERGIELDPYSATIASDLADLYYRRSQTQGDIAERARLWELSASYFGVAFENETDPARKEKYGNEAAALYYGLAREAMAENKSREARAMLYKGGRYASPASEVARNIESLLDQLTG